MGGTDSDTSREGDRRPRVETLLASAFLHPDAATGAMVPPLHLATTFDQRSDAEYTYARKGNPTRTILERVMAALEGGSTLADGEMLTGAAPTADGSSGESPGPVAAAFASGMAACAAVIASLDHGAHVVYPDDAYNGFRRLMTNLAPRWGVSSTTADFTDPDAVAAAIRPETRLVWIETPSNPLLRITDLRAVAGVASARGIAVVADNTWATPMLQHPFDHGADLVVHAVTKYIAGHSDVLGGAVVARDASGLFSVVREIQQTAGGVMDPFSAWMTLRGLRTLAVRMERACDNADQLAAFLSNHPAVARVHYPGLPDHPGREVAMRQMARSGAMISFEVDGPPAFATRVPTLTTVFRNATSLGGTESLIEHRATSEGEGSMAPPRLIRISVGIEHAADLIDDLDRALTTGGGR